MSQYYYPINSYELSKRKRYNKEYLQEGQIVLYSLDRYGTGLMIFEKKDPITRDMKIYEATEYEAIWARAQSVNESYYHSEYKEVDDRGTCKTLCL